jgi:hypothetical protein
MLDARQRWAALIIILVGADINQSCGKGYTKTQCAVIIYSVSILQQFYRHLL